MPLPAASVSRAETSALDQEAAAMVDDLETSLAASLPKRRLSGKGTPPSRSDATDDDDEGVDQSRRADGQGLVEPSLLVAASAGLGAAAPLVSLLPLWDYLLVRHDKHFGYVKNPRHLLCFCACVFAFESVGFGSARCGVKREARERKIEGKKMSLKVVVIYIFLCNALFPSGWACY